MNEEKRQIEEKVTVNSIQLRFNSRIHWFKMVFLQTNEVNPAKLQFFVHK